MEERLRRGARLCRRMAVGALVVGFVGSMGVAMAFGRGSYGDGLSLPAFLTVVFVSVLGLVLALCLILLAAQTLEGLADLLAHAARLSAATRAAPRTRAGNPRNDGWQSHSLHGPGPATTARLPAEAVIGQLASIKEVVEHIRLGHFVKVTTSDGLTGWIRDSDLPPASAPSGPRPAGGNGSQVGPQAVATP